MQIFMNFGLSFRFFEKKRNNADFFSIIIKYNFRERIRQRSQVIPCFKANDVYY